MRYIKKLGTLTGAQLPATKTYVHTDEPLYSDGSGRTLDGTFSGTLVGWFPKLVFSFPPLTPTETQRVRNALRRAVVTVEWFDQANGVYRTDDFYTTSITAGVLIAGKYDDELTVTLIAVRRL